MLHNGNEAVGTDGRVNLYPDSISKNALRFLVDSNDKISKKTSIIIGYLKKYQYICSVL